MSQLVSAPYPPVLELRPSTTISGLPSDTYIIFAVADARIYHAQLTTKTPEWCFSRMRGTLVFGKDCDPREHRGHRPASANEASCWFRLLDSASGKPIWMFKIPAGFVYELDRPFFHAFQGKSRRFGFLFEDDDEAHILAKKVAAHTYPPRAAKSRSLSFSLRSKSPSDSVRAPILPSMISLPSTNSFVHVAHVGLNGEGIIEATSEIDPSWIAILNGRSHLHFDERSKVPGKKSSIGDGFWRNQEWEASHSRGGSTPDHHGKAAIPSTLRDTEERSIAPKEKARRKMPSPSFTMF
ncbi:hypothetical protein C0991_007632 [Blastosporella zonata]|nr:hypothetical protein C0991_007632 [Blastosporella zonata]